MHIVRWSLIKEIRIFVFFDLFDEKEKPTDNNEKQEQWSDFIEPDQSLNVFY